MAPVLSLPITHYPSFLGLIIPLGPLVVSRQTDINPASNPTLLSHPTRGVRQPYVHKRHTATTLLLPSSAISHGESLHPLHSSLPGAVSARLLNPAILSRIPSITACLRVSKKFIRRTTATSCGKWHARTTSHAASPSTCQNSRRLLDAARRMRALLLTLSRKPLVLSPLPRQQSEEPEPEPEAVVERLKSGVLLRLHLLRS